MFTVTVKDHMMIAHSLPDPFFGDAQAMHGATYAVEAEFGSETLTAQNVVVDIGAACTALAKIMKTLTLKNLDDLPQFSGQLTTTEFLAHHIHSELRKKIADVNYIKVTLHESPTAMASYSDQ